MIKAVDDDASMSVVITGMIKAKEITQSDVITLRTKVFKDGIYTQKRAATLIALERVCKKSCPDWADYYVTSLSDYILCRTEPSGGIDDENTKWLRGMLSKDGLIKTQIEFQLLKRILERAVPAVPSFCAFVLDQLHFAMMGFPENYIKPEAVKGGKVKKLPDDMPMNSIDVIDKLSFLEPQK